jgi:hypothetical protein
MSECYHLALARDVPYTRDVDAHTLFRIDLSGVTIGPYLSQFLLQPYTFGGTPIQQHYRTTMPAATTSPPMRGGWRSRTAGRPAPRRGSTRCLATSATAGTWARAHRDFSYQGPLVACLILLDYLAQHGREVLDDNNPYRASAT